MKILFLSGLYSTPALPGGGVPNARIVRAMRAHADIRIVSPVPWYPRAVARRVPRVRPLAELPRNDRDVDGALVQRPRRLHLPGLPALQAGLYAASLLGPVRRELARFPADVLLSAWAFPDGTAAVALARALGLPTVVRTMGSDINDYAHKPRRGPQIRWAMRNADRVIAVSGALGDVLADLGVARERIRVIPTGVEPALFRPVARADARRELELPEGPLVLVPSRLAPEKGIDVFVEALSRVTAPATAVLAGDGPEEARLRADVARLGLDHRVRFAGFQLPERMPLYYAAADLVCLPSHEEGWPNALMESLACGCPFVASDVGGVPEILALTGSGMLSPPGDPAGLAAVLERALAHPWDRDATAAAMREHTLQNTARRYAETCAEVM